MDISWPDFFRPLFLTHPPTSDTRHIGQTPGGSFVSEIDRRPGRREPRESRRSYCRKPSRTTLLGRTAKDRRAMFRTFLGETGSGQETGPEIADAAKDVEGEEEVDVVVSVISWNFTACHTTAR